MSEETRDRRLDRLRFSQDGDIRFLINLLDKSRDDALAEVAASGIAGHLFPGYAGALPLVEERNRLRRELADALKANMDLAQIIRDDVGSMEAVRLRAALMKIDSYGPDPGDAGMLSEDIYHIAHAALTEVPECYGQPETQTVGQEEK